MSITDSKSENYEMCRNSLARFLSGRPREYTCDSATVFRDDRCLRIVEPRDDLQFRRRLNGALLAQIREPEMRVIFPLPEGDVVVGWTRAQQIYAVIIQGIKDRCRVAIVQSVRVARAVILSAQCGSSQRMDVGVAVVADDAGRARRGRRFGANGTLLTLNMTHITCTSDRT